MLELSFMQTPLCELYKNPAKWELFMLMDVEMEP